MWYSGTEYVIPYPINTEDMHDTVIYEGDEGWDGRLTAI